MKKSATNSTIMRRSNRKLILNLIRKKPSSRAELARITGLTRAAVTMIVDELIGNGLLLETGNINVGFGRNPILLDLNTNSFFVIGLCIAREGCFISISNIKSESLMQRKFILDQSLGVDDCMQVLIQQAEKIISDIGVPIEKIIGMGIAVPGPVDIYQGTILNPPNFNLWHHVNIVNVFKKHFDFPVYIENNAAALALAENVYGMGVEFDSFLLLLVNEGVGAGIIIENKLYKGEKGFGSEVGHTSIDFNGRQCNCGNKGCIETYAAVPAVVKTLRDDGINVDSWEDVVDKALDGNKRCKMAILDEARYLSAGIVNVMNIMELEAVILAGDINYKPRLLLEAVRNNAENTLITRKLRELYIMNSSITENIEVKAAASVMLDHFFD